MIVMKPTVIDLCTQTTPNGPTSKSFGSKGRAAQTGSFEN
jgi:hypothetical protein